MTKQELEQEITRLNTVVGVLTKQDHILLEIRSSLGMPNGGGRDTPLEDYKVAIKTLKERLRDENREYKDKYYNICARIVEQNINIGNTDSNNTLTETDPILNHIQSILGRNR